MYFFFFTDTYSPNPIDFNAPFKQFIFPNKHLNITQTCSQELDFELNARPEWT